MKTTTDLNKDELINAKNNWTKNITIGLVFTLFYLFNWLLKKMAKYKPIVMFLVKLFLALM